MSSTLQRFDDAARAGVYAAIHQRRDVRYFLPQPMDPDVLLRLLEAAHAAPSVGLSQPWRFLRIRCPALRNEIHALVQSERLLTADALGARREEFLRLKVEGIRNCAELLVIAMQDGGTREVFGRRSLPQMTLASVACAIQNLWLAARAEGIGLGWVSMFDPAALARLLHLPPDLSPVAVLCLGVTDRFDEVPLLQLVRWRTPRPLHELLVENRWPADGVPA